MPGRPGDLWRRLRDTRLSLGDLLVDHVRFARVRIRSGNVVAVSGIGDAAAAEGRMGEGGDERGGGYRTGKYSTLGGGGGGGST